MKKTLFLLFIFLGLNTGAIAQTISGILINDSTDEPVVLANIGVLDSKSGTYSGEDGSFDLKLPKDLNAGTLVISAIGFEPIRVDFVADELKDHLRIRLIPKEYELPSFTVSDSRIKTNRVGNPWLPLVTNRMAWAADIHGSRIGKSIAIKINLKHKPPIRIDEVSFGIYENPWKETTFRLRIMSIDPETGKPGDDLLNIQKTSLFTEKAGWVHFQFDDYPLILTTQDFYIVAENIDDDGNYRDFGKSGMGVFPIYMFNFMNLSKQQVFLSNEGLQEWVQKDKDPTFRLKYAYEK